MLNIVLVNKISNFYDYCSKLISEDHKDLVIVSPSPSYSDLIRKNLDSRRIANNSVTIAKFIQDELALLLDENEIEQFKSKSELFTLLAATWKQIGRTKDFKTFKKAFNLLTEFRSFSMNDQVLEEVLENYDDEISDGVMWMHRVLTNLEIIDEQKSYFLLSERLREGDLSNDYLSDRKIIFYGFDFMSASQIDLLRSLSMRDELYIPVYKEVYENVGRFEWIKWFEEADTNILSLDDSIDESSIQKVHFFSRGYLSKKLKDIDVDFSSVILGAKSIQQEFTQEIPFDNLRVKSRVDIFSEKITKTFEVIEKSYDYGVDSNVIVSLIENEISSDISSQDFRKLKISLLLKKKLQEWIDLSSANEVFDLFDFKVLQETTKLDAPRVNITTITNEESIPVFSFSEMDQINNSSVLFIVDSNYGPIGGAKANYTENVEKYLSSIGPIRTSDFELKTLKKRFQEFCSHNKVSFLLETGILEHDLQWSTIFSGMDYEEVNSSLKEETSFTHQFDISHKYELKSLSASKLQKYLECPYKFYAQYVQKFNLDILLPEELTSIELGRIQHKVIELYFKKENVFFDKDLHRELIKAEMVSFEKSKNFTPLKAKEYFLEIEAYTAAIIEQLLYFTSSGEFEAHFEYEFLNKVNGISFNGSIDCLLMSKGGNRYIILDFKRSSALFSSYAKIENFEVIQLWFYLKQLMEQKLFSDVDDFAIGYIDLSNNENSRIMGNSSDIIIEVKEKTNFKFVKEMVNFDEKINEYKKLEDSLVDNISIKQSFSPLPLNKDVCTFCLMNKICTRNTYGISK